MLCPQRDMRSLMQPVGCLLRRVHADCVTFMEHEGGGFHGRRFDASSQFPLCCVCDVIYRHWHGALPSPGGRGAYIGT